MASLEMYNQNSDHKGLGPPMSPRISFSNDFAESTHSHQQFIMPTRPSSRDSGPISSDFEFSSVTKHSMMSADELFFKGRLLPMREQLQKTTLRDELLAGEDDDDDGGFSLRPPKGSGRWKGLLGLRKSHIGSKKSDKSGDGPSEKRSGLSHDEGSSVSKEMWNEGG